MSDDWLIRCDSCGADYRARRELAGRTLRCRCGETLQVHDPTADQETEKADLSLADFEPVAEPDIKNEPAPAPTTGRISPVMEALMSREDEVGLPIFRERLFPYLFLSIGAAAQLILWFVWIISPGKALIVMGVAVAIQAIVFVPLMLFMMVSVAKWIDLDMGSFFSFVFKVAALTLGPLGVADAFLTISLVVSDFDWHVIVAGFGFYVVLGGLPTWILFRTNVGETALILVVNFLPRTVAIYFAASVLNGMKIIG